MDDIDKRILNILQSEFPLVREPFALIAQKVGISEEEVLARITTLKENGAIRRLGAVFDPGRLGYVSALCAARVRKDRERLFIETVNACEGVTHNYRRDDTYNIWFTVIVPGEKDLAAFLESIKDKTGISDLLCMRATRTFKVNAQFEV
ncbi:MAG: AsnC family transcriptional regulator [Syntrophales bacterium]|nr:AsnC family transcriptional regulator [Syntrophales bacterium]